MFSVLLETILLVLLLQESNGLSFSYTGSSQQFTVPSTAAWMYIVLNGARGGNYNGYSGGNGGQVSGYYPVTGGSVYYVYIGGMGSDSTGSGQAGYNGGGVGNSVQGCGGGGASDIRTSTTLASRIFVAGGGGGLLKVSQFNIC